MTTTKTIAKRIHTTKDHMIAAAIVAGCPVILFVTQFAQHLS